MRITHLFCEVVTMQLSTPYTIAYEHVSETTNVFLVLETESGLRGCGCAAPDLEVTGETADTVTDRFERVARPLLSRQDPFRHSFYLETLRQTCQQHPAFLAMIDMALYDLLARKADLPLYQLLGGFRDSMPTSITIGILDVEKTVEAALNFRKQGFRMIKIKGGLDLDGDIERVRKVREAIGPEPEIRFDANQGYLPEQAIRFVQDTASCRVEILEQPTRRDAFDQLGEVARQTHLPVMADESLLTLDDAFRLARQDAADMINIKLMKVGGISQALHINSVARSAGMEAMVGCMDESALGIAAGLHFALARPNVAYADLDGHLDLLGDPAAGAVLLRDGVLYPNKQAGLGFSL